MWAKLIVSQVFGISAGYVAQERWSKLFGSTPFIVPLAAWLIMSVIVIVKL